MTNIKHYVLSFEVSVDEPKTDELLESSDYLKHYITQLAVVSVLERICSKIHIIPLYIEYEGIAAEENPLECSNMLEI